MKAEIEPATLVGVGVALAGRQGGGGQRLLRTNSSKYAWEPFAVRDTLRAAIDHPIVVENDSTCAAIGEFWAGRIPSVNDFATVYMAAGFGLGLVTDGDVYRGSSSNVGEIGHMVLDVNGPQCWCGSRGLPGESGRTGGRGEACRAGRGAGERARPARPAAGGPVRLREDRPARGRRRPALCAADRGVRDVPGARRCCRSRTCSTSTRSSSPVPASARPATSTSGSRPAGAQPAVVRPRDASDPGRALEAGPQRRRPRRRVPRPPQPAHPAPEVRRLALAASDRLRRTGGSAHAL